MTDAAKPVEWILKPGELLRKRQAPNGNDAEKYEAYARLQVRRVAEDLAASGVTPTAASVTVMILRKLLLGETFEDEARRSEWFKFLYPTVKQSLAMP